jgi:hypothetical protein
LSPPDSGHYQNLLPWMIRHQVYLNSVACLSEYGHSVFFFPLGEMQVNLWMLWRGETVHFIVRFLEMVKFTTQTLSLLMMHKLSFLIVGLKMASLPALSLNSIRTI